MSLSPQNNPNDRRRSTGRLALLGPTVAVVGVGVALAVASQSHTSTAPAPPPPPAISAPQTPPSAQGAAQTNAGTDAAGNPTPLRPDPALTPGDTLPVTAADVCVSGYSQKVRNVPEDVKRQVYAEYGIKSRQPGEYEVDHLISLELGGSNSVKNLWPQSYKTRPWNAHVKDRLENELHSEVCAGKITLSDAQTEIRTDWIAAYQKRFSAPAR